MNEKRTTDDALFEELESKRKRRKKKIIRTLIIVVVLLAIILSAGVMILRRQVRNRFASSNEEVLSYEASVGSISTSVSGSGSLTNVDLENISVPAGVEIEEVIIAANTKVAEGDVIAAVNMASVLNAMSVVQDELDSIDDQLVTAKTATVGSYISSGVQGRVKKIYAQSGTDVAACIYDNGALALLSLDGYMAIDIETDKLSAGDSVKVVRSDGTEFEGYVEKNINGVATILVTDNGPEYEESVSINDSSGAELGSGKLYIHSPMRITGISGTVNYIYVVENQQVYSGSTLFVLGDTEYSASYEIILRERNDTEETLLQLMEIYRSGALCAPFSGTISSIDYDESSVTEDAETLIATISPDKSMSITINVDESDILSLELGQTAQISIDSLGENVFTGELTEINKTASSSSGVTRYSAVVTLDKTENMLAGMSASVVIRISGVDNAVIIPVDALHQTSSTSFVYTEYDEDTGKFSGMTEVVTGISNSSYVEIISGLSEGDTVYYTESENRFSFGGMGMPGGFDGMGMPGGFGGGDMPSMGFGGNMPSGEMPSGGDFGGRRDFRGGMPSGGMPGGFGG